jgi:hypothetical protein
MSQSRRNLLFIGTATTDGGSIPSVPFLVPQSRKLNELVAERNQKRVIGDTARN